MGVLRGQTALQAAANAAGTGGRTQCSCWSRGWRAARRALGKDGARGSGRCAEMHSAADEVANGAAAWIVNLKDCGGVPRPDGLGIPWGRLILCSPPCGSIFGPQGFMQSYAHLCQMCFVCCPLGRVGRAWPERRIKMHARRPTDVGYCLHRPEPMLAASCARDCQRQSVSAESRLDAVVITTRHLRYA